MRRLLCLAALLLAPISAGAQSASSAVLAVQAASSEVVAYLPFVRQFELAEALRLAALHGKRVFLITSTDGAREGQGFTIRLAHVQGVRTYLAPSQGMPFVLVDGTQAFSGPGLMLSGAGQGVSLVGAAPLLAWAQSVTASPPLRPLQVLELRYPAPR